MAAKRRPATKKLNLVLICDETKNDDMVSLIRAHRPELADITLLAPKETGELLWSKAGCSIEMLASLRHGGAHQVKDLALQEELRGVIYLRDPLNPTPALDITALLRTCDEHDIPLATNLASGEAVIHLMAEHPEALSGHHLAAQYLEDMAEVNG